MARKAAGRKVKTSPKSGERQKRIAENPAEDISEKTADEAGPLTPEE
jgi:hypothetical protein